MSCPAAEMRRTLNRKTEKHRRETNGKQQKPRDVVGQGRKTSGMFSRRMNCRGSFGGRLMRAGIAPGGVTAPKNGDRSGADDRADRNGTAGTQSRWQSGFTGEGGVCH